LNWNIPARAVVEVKREVDDPTATVPVVKFRVSALLLKKCVRAVLESRHMFSVEEVVQPAELGILNWPEGARALVSSTAVELPTKEVEPFEVHPAPISLTAVVEVA